MSRHERYIPPFVWENIEAMKQLRKSMKLTQKAAAEKSGLNLTTVHRLEHGELSPSQGVYNKLAALFNWPLWT